MSSEVRRNFATNIRFTLAADIDPFNLCSDEVVCDVKYYSHIELTDVKNHPVGCESFATRDKFKASKLVDAHNYVTGGWVQQHRVREFADGHCVSSSET
ncbi:hypothetical protein HPB51_019126 [Rhipicephalus microplus]|uniref:Uncharacterized protein n=1 Tax=Rhipicephalus microplus TaxID=6941 RepID=A0A9J6DW81_RHIMP|nr:hypothetical protein HPB51_019126 [Rhipicephalus microplus]